MRKDTRKETTIRTTDDLRTMLIETIDQVRAGSIDYRQATAIGGLTTKILQSAKLDLEVLKFRAMTGEQDASGSRKVLQLVAAE